MKGTARNSTCRVQDAPRTEKSYRAAFGQKCPASKENAPQTAKAARQPARQTKNVGYSRRSRLTEKPSAVGMGPACRCFRLSNNTAPLSTKKITTAVSPLT